MKLVAVTGCPTGVAHCWMAAERIEQAARDRGHEVSVEVHAADGVENPLEPPVIAAADAAIVAVDTSIDVDRFADLPTVQSTVHDAVTSATDLVAAAEEGSNGVEDPSANARAGRPSGEGTASGDGADGLLARILGLFG